ncbi:hypothetical protein [Vibrio harveyi]|uniref:hypothetical protein n=1 Tax=Vibrio harveyi TaxID=669 RepID=UPI0024814960|nr:hypothetical protein [Vibrio harveyi]
MERDSFELVRIYAYKSVVLGKKPAPKLIRKLVAKMMLHRAWLQGHTGSFLASVLGRR